MSMIPDGTTSHKFAVVINKKLAPSRALNAIGHMLASLVARTDEDHRRQMMIVDYLDKVGTTHPVSGLSLVVLQAKNANQIRKARVEAAQAGLLFTDFMESMTGGTYVEQMQRTAQLGVDDIEYWGLAVFGEKSAVDRVCGKFSLWRDPETAAAPSPTAAAGVEPSPAPTE